MEVGQCTEQVISEIKILKVNGKYIEVEDYLLITKDKRKEPILRFTYKCNWNVHGVHIGLIPEKINYK